MLLGSPRPSHRSQLIILSCVLVAAFLGLMVYTLDNFFDFNPRDLYSIPSSWKFKNHGEDSTPASQSSPSASSTNGFRNGEGKNQESWTDRDREASHLGLQDETSSSSTASKWKFDPARDRFNYSLSDGQCEEAFPDYFYEIERAAAYYEDRPITKEDVDIKERMSVVRATIYDRQLYIMKSNISHAPANFDFPRTNAILASINRAVTASTEPVPDIEFVFKMSDYPGEPAPDWTLCREAEDQAHWVMPDFGYWAWDNQLLGAYEQYVRGLSDYPSKFSEKKEKALWRGTNSNDERQHLIEAAEDKPWSDVKAVQWGKPDNFVGISEHCDYQYLIQTEGNTYSGRLKYILNCASVVLLRPPHWIETFTHLLQPRGSSQNVVEVDGFVNLPETMSSLLEDPKKAEQIATNAKDTFADKYLTPAAQACYWRRMFKRWKDVQGFEARPWTMEKKTVGEGDDKKEVEKKVWHGITYEVFMLQSHWRKGDYND
ncbi:MAG: hypothetical protein M1820_007344 [Bogoriella megaspora]|nr:MAG: hypothetical protein M1820_007344 [Bogoriella megaspora]